MRWIEFDVVAPDEAAARAVAEQCCEPPTVTFRVEARAVGERWKVEVLASDLAAWVSRERPPTVMEIRIAKPTDHRFWSFVPPEAVDAYNRALAKRPPKQ